MAGSTVDLQPLVYNFKYSYYENYKAARHKAFATSGDFFSMWRDSWNNADSVKVIDDGIGNAVTVNNGVEVAWYVKKHYNGDMPECLTDKIALGIREIHRYALAFVTLGISLLLEDFFTDLFKSFICSATLNTVGNECGHKMLTKLKEYRNIRLEDAEIRDMYRHYTIIGPKIVKAIDADEDTEVIYQYLYAEYISKILILVEERDDFGVLEVYFKMVTDMVNRYDIKVSKRFRKWQKNWM